MLQAKTLAEEEDDISDESQSGEDTPSSPAGSTQLSQRPATRAAQRLQFGTARPPASPKSNAHDLEADSGSTGHQGAEISQSNHRQPVKVDSSGKAGGAKAVSSRVEALKARLELDKAKRQNARRYPQLLLAHFLAKA